MATRRALITGVTGQDGAYLAQFLLAKGYQVFGMVRPGEGGASEGLRWLGIEDDISLVVGDLTDQPGLERLLQETAPDEVYNLAAQSSVISSFDRPTETAHATGLGALNVLEALRRARPQARLFQASSSAMLDLRGEGRKGEATPSRPRSPYGVAKLFAHWSTVTHRERFGLHASSGILFNHESPLRGLDFVTRKVTDGAARIKLGLARELRLGNVDALRDWGHARDYVRAMWLMLQQDRPDDYVIATGRVSTVRETCEIAFDAVGLKASDHVVVDPALLRPPEAGVPCGDPSKAARALGWTAEVSLEAMIREMVEADLARLRQVA